MANSLKPRKGMSYSNVELRRQSYTELDYIFSNKAEYKMKFLKFNSINIFIGLRSSCSLFFLNTNFSNGLSYLTNNYTSTQGQYQRTKPN